MNEIKFYQAVQTRPDALLVRIVPDKGFTSETRDQALQNLKQWIGPDFQIELQLVDDIERTEAGKCRVVIVDIKNEPS